MISSFRCLRFSVAIEIEGGRCSCTGVLVGMTFSKRVSNSLSGGGPLLKSFLNKSCYVIAAKHN